MSTITQTGNLASKPELRTSRNGNPWTEARVLHTERLQVGDHWQDGVTTAYSVKVFGAVARHLVAAAQTNSKNLRVRFSSRLSVLDVQPKDGSTVRVHEIEAGGIDPVFVQDAVLIKGLATPENTPGETRPNTAPEPSFAE